MNSTTQLHTHHHTPEGADTFDSNALHLQHLQQNHRKDSQGSIQTKASDHSDSLETQPMCCHHFCLEQQQICSKCGVYFSKKEGCWGVKSNRFYGASWNIRNLRQASERFQTKLVKPLNFISRDVISKTSEQFGFSLPTQSLGVYIYYSVFEGINEFLQIVISLFVAAKLMEHTSAKSLRRYRKYLNKCFSYSDYREMEGFILEKLNFDLAVPTFMDFIYSYLHQGITLSNEAADAVKLQNLLISKTEQILFQGTFMMFPPEVVASNLLYQIRNKTGCKEPWSQSIQRITDLTDPYFIFSASEPERQLQL